MNTLKKYAKPIKLVFKILLSAAALYYVFSKINIQQTLNTVKDINLAVLSLSVIIYACSQIFSSLRLNTLYKYVPVQIKAVENIKLYWLGMFYNLFLPGGIGGDGYKVYLINKHFNTSVKRLIGTIFADRLSGLCAITTYICLFTYFINYDLSSVEEPQNGIAFIHHFIVWIAQYLKYFIVLIPFIAIAYYLYIRTFSSHLKPATFKVLGFSLIIQALQMVAAIIILKSMGAELSGRREDYLFLFMLSSVMSAIPISLGGLGLREITFMFGSQYLGLNQDHAVALSLIFYLMTLFVSLFGSYFAYNPNIIFGNRFIENNTENSGSNNQRECQFSKGEIS